MNAVATIAALESAANFQNLNVNVLRKLNRQAMLRDTAPDAAKELDRRKRLGKKDEDGKDEDGEE